MSNPARKFDVPEEFLEHVTQSTKPIVVSKAGYKDAVVVNKQSLFLLENKSKIEEGIASADNGKVSDFRAGMRDFFQKRGVKSDI